VGHAERVEGIDRALLATPGIFVSGSAYRGVGIADCVRQAGEAAGKVTEFLGGMGRTAEPEQTDEREAIGWTT
jgi:oxygen-dependent protoporphyrinogen oxidase